MFNEAVSEFESKSYIQRLLPSMLMTSITFGSIPMVVTLQSDIDSGFFQRMRVLSIWPYSLLVARVFFDVIRVIISSIALLLVGFALEYEFSFSTKSIVYFVALLGLVSITYCSFSFAIALMQVSTEALTSALSAIYLCSIFASLGLGPIEAFPSWIHPLVIYNPVSLFVDTVMQISAGVYSGWLSTIFIFLLTIILFTSVSAFLFRRISHR